MNVEISLIIAAVTLLPLAIGWGAVALRLSTTTSNVAMMGVVVGATAYIWHKWGWQWALAAYVPIVIATVVMTVVGIFAPELIEATKRKLHK